MRPAPGTPGSVPAGFTHAVAQFVLRFPTSGAYSELSLYHPDRCGAGRPLRKHRADWMGAVTADDDLLGDIVSYYERPDIPVPLDRFRSWGMSDDINVQGAAFTLFADAAMRERIIPPLPFDDCVGFQLRYFEHCIRDDPSWEDDMLLSRYAACHSCRAFIVWLSQSPQNDYAVSSGAVRSWLGKLPGMSRGCSPTGVDVARMWMRALYESGGAEVRLALETGIFEHLFPDRRIRGLFRDWKTDPLMGEVLARNCGGPWGGDCR